MANSQMCSAENMGQALAAPLLPLAEQFNSVVVDGAFLGTHDAWLQEIPERRAATIQSMSLPKGCLVSVLSTNSGRVVFLESDAGLCTVHLPDGDSFRSRPWGSFVFLGHGVYSEGNSLVAASACDPALHLLDLDTWERVETPLSYQLGDTVSGGSFRQSGVTPILGGLLVTCHFQGSAHVVHLDNFSHGRPATAFPWYKARSAEAVRFFNEKVHILSYDPSLTLGVFQPNATGGGLAPLRRMALAGYPGDIVPVRDGFWVTVYGSIIKYSLDYQPLYRVDMGAIPPLRPHCYRYPVLAFTDNDDSLPFWIGVGMGKDLHLVRLD